jgi:hypothetical protein
MRPEQVCALSVVMAITNAIVIMVTEVTVAARALPQCGRTSDWMVHSPV